MSMLHLGSFGWTSQFRGLFAASSQDRFSWCCIRKPVLGLLNVFSSKATTLETIPGIFGGATDSIIVGDSQLSMNEVYKQFGSCA